MYIKEDLPFNFLDYSLYFARGTMETSRHKRSKIMVEERERKKERKERETEGEKRERERERVCETRQCGK